MKMPTEKRRKYIYIYISRRIGKPNTVKRKGVKEKNDHRTKGIDKIYKYKKEKEKEKEEKDKNNRYSGRRRE